VTIFNNIYPIGREVSHFLGNAEVEAALLRKGQPYSVCPKRFARADETRAKTSDAVAPLRTEGPLLSVQWSLLNSQNDPLIRTTRAVVPEEITLLQFWKLIIARRYSIPAERVLWANHYREGNVIGTGKVTSLTVADSVEIIVEEKKKPQHCEVSYTVARQRLGTSGSVFLWRTRADQ
jgi:hypothetical protein